MRNDGTAWQVIIVEPCLSWLHELRRSDRLTLIQISQAITVLAEEGPGLGRPLVDTVSGSKAANLKELLDRPETNRGSGRTGTRPPYREPKTPTPST